LAEIGLMKSTEFSSRQDCSEIRGTLRERLVVGSAVAVAQEIEQRSGV
jgi:hypothetical protein